MPEKLLGGEQNWQVEKCTEGGTKEENSKTEGEQGICGRGIRSSRVF